MFSLFQSRALAIKRCSMQWWNASKSDTSFPIVHFRGENVNLRFFGSNLTKRGCSECGLKIGH